MKIKIKSLSQNGRCEDKVYKIKREKDKLFPKIVWNLNLCIRNNKNLTEVYQKFIELSQQRLSKKRLLRLKP